MKIESNKITFWIDQNVTAGRFGRPLVFRISRDASLKELQNLIFAQFRPYIKEDVRIISFEKIFQIKVSLLIWFQ